MTKDEMLKWFGGAMRVKINTINQNTTAAGNHAVIYARYSSSGQNEQTIDGQLRACREYAQRMGYTVINEYIDRAKTGTNDKRPSFQNMIADASSGQFQYVIVYMVDRFARNKYDSTIYKYELKSNGVRVVSAMEAITDTEEGYLVEGLLEMFAEQYSRKLSVRIRNSFKDALERGTAWGGLQLLGYKTENKKYVIDKEKAPIIRYLFTEYAAGKPHKQIINELNAMGHRTNKGRLLTINSLQNALRNPKYIGQHIIDGVVYNDRFPQLIDEETFFAVQQRLDLKKRAPNTGGGAVDYLLTGKAHCGHCGANMVGVSGTGRHGGKHYYYACVDKHKNRSCDKKNEAKDRLEEWIVRNVQQYILLKESASRIADLVLAEYNRFINTTSVRELEKRIADIDKQIGDIADLMISSARNTAVVRKLDEKANDLSLQKDVLDAELAKLRLAIRLPHTKEDIISYLAEFAKGNASDPEYRRRIIDRLINSVFVYDDQILVYFNILDDRHITFDAVPDLQKAEVIPLDDSPQGVCISSVPARQTKRPLYVVVFLLFYKVLTQYNVLSNIVGAFRVLTTFFICLLICV